MIQSDWIYILDYESCTIQRCVFNVVSVGWNLEEFGLGWQDCQQAVTGEFLCIVAGCDFGNRWVSLDV